MMTRASVFLLILSLSGVALAKDVKNDTFGVTATPPEAWTVVSSKDEVLASFKHEKSQSQIHGAAVKLASADSVPTFFATYRKTLLESGFESEEDPTPRTIEGIQGTESTFKFIQKSTKLDVLVYTFSRGDTAWIVTGYLKSSKLRGAVAEVVSNLEFEKNADSPSW